MKSKYIVPDKGFAWLMLMGAIGSHILVADTFSTSGVFYEEYTERFEVSKALAAWISGIKLLMHGASSFMCGILLPYLGARYLVILCSVMTVSGYVITMYVTNIYAVLISYGAASGLGLATVTTVWLQVMSTFFKRHRGLAFGLAVGAVAVGSTIFPMLLHYLFSEYSWKGALLINGGIHLNNLVFCLLMPSDFGRNENRMNNSTKQQRTSSDASSGSTFIINEKGEKEDASYHGRKLSSFSNNSKEDDGHDNENIKFDRSKWSNTEVDENNTQNVEGEKAMNQSLLQLLADKILVLFIIGVVFVKYGHISTYAYIPSLGVEISLTKTQASAMVSMMAAVNIVGRPVMGFLSDCGPCRPKRPSMFAFVCAIYGLLVMALGWSNSFIYMSINVLLIGLCASYEEPVFSSLLAELGGPKAMILMPLISCAGVFSGTVIGGLILEVTGTCTWVMMVAGGVQMFGSILLFINCKLM